ncbi:MAG: hypothetical protein RL418_138 [Actinomycetota bacterium]
MAKQINPSLARLWQQDNLRRYGSINPQFVRVDSEAQHRALDLIESGLTNTQFEDLETLAKIKTGELNTLIDRLGPLISSTSSFIPSFTSTEVEQRFAEILRVYSLGELDPAITLQKRRLAKVFLSTLSRPGLVAARGLFAMGIGQILSFDGTKVRQADVTELGYPASAIGQTKHQAAKELLDKSRSSLQLHSRLTESLESLDVAILIANDVVQPEQFQPWMTRETPHIAICFSELGAEISQLVIPGITPCLACNELQRISSDPNRISIATQLSGLTRDFADSATLLASLGFALTQLIRFIDFGHLQPDQNTPMELIAKTGKFVPGELTRVNCGCIRPNLDTQMVHGL